MSIRNLFVAAGVTVGLMSGAAMAAGPETVAGPGSFVYIPRGMVHGWWNRSDAEVQMLSAVTPAGFEQFFVAIGTPADAAHPTPPPVDPAAVAKIGQMAPHYNMEVISGW